LRDREEIASGNFFPVNRMKVKECDIPMEVLFNDLLDEHKNIEKHYGLAPRPISFTIQKYFQGT